ncbi:MAG: HEPN domain-containing protein [Treponema sp.]|nr:HEPN domain-containing protein [Treponema sp.]
MDKQTNSPEDWVFLADRDLNVANHLAATMHPSPTEIIAFHCQQAVEKYLKGALVIFNEEPPYIHDLDILCSMALKHRASFVSISTLCVTIKYFAVQPRYDRGLSLSEEDMKIVLAHTKTIKEFLQKELPELFQVQEEQSFH